MTDPKPMSDLEALKREHPEWCWNCGDPMCGLFNRGFVDGKPIQCTHSHALAALLALAEKLEAKVQQHEATIAERDRVITTWKEEEELWKQREVELYAFAQFIEQETTHEDGLFYERLHEKAMSVLHGVEEVPLLVKLQATIQQQARELEEADREIIMCVRSYQKHGASGASTPCTRIYDAALARHSTRAQQAEAKKEEPNG